MVNTHQKLAAFALWAIMTACGDDGGPSQELAQCRTINASNRDHCEARTVRQAIATPFDNQAFQPLDPIVVGFESNIINYGEELSFLNMSTDYVFLNAEQIEHGRSQEFESFGLYEHTKVKLRVYLTREESASVLWNQNNQLRVVVKNERKDDYRFSDASALFFSDSLVGQSNVGLSRSADGQAIESQTTGPTKATVWVSDSATPFVSNTNAGISLGVMDSVNPHGR